MDFLTHADLTGRIRGLVIMLDDKITIEQSRRAEELVDGDEFDAALELLAGLLAAGPTALPDDLRVDFERLSIQVGNHDAVMGVLGRVAGSRGIAGRSVDPLVRVESLEESPVDRDPHRLGVRVVDDRPERGDGEQHGEQLDDRDVGNGGDEQRDEHDREEPADRDDVDREGAGEVPRLALEVQPAPGAVRHHRQVVTEEVAGTAARAAPREAPPEDLRSTRSGRRHDRPT
jgi:hypothetical protein